jgi:hypothetical protein
MSSPTAILDASLCPICGQANQCAMETERATGQKQPPCWCTRAAFAPDLLAQLPPAVQGQACICQACADRGSDARP